MASKAELLSRVAELVDDLRQRDDKITELRDDLDEQRELNGKMREHLEDRKAIMDNVIEAFGMEHVGDHMHFRYAPGDVADKYNELLGDYNNLVGRWNREFAGRSPGRPLAASETQVDEVRRLRKDGLSLRLIVAETNLGLRTVRTIIEKDAGTDRTSKREAEKRKRMFDKMRAREWRDRKRSLDQLPKRIAATQRDGDELIKAAKGLTDDARRPLPT